MYIEVDGSEGDGSDGSIHVQSLRRERSWRSLRRERSWRSLRRGRGPRECICGLHHESVFRGGQKRKGGRVQIYECMLLD